MRSFTRYNADTTLDNPEIYSEYAPYKYIDDLREFMNQAGNLNLVV
ncbi:DUF6718 family protein [Sporofaciens musculi]